MHIVKSDTTSYGSLTWPATALVPDKEQLMFEILSMLGRGRQRRKFVLGILGLEFLAQCAKNSKPKMPRTKRYVYSDTNHY